jgi:genetic interactor of prohibitins 3, mitochondrial
MTKVLRTFRTAFLGRRSCSWLSIRPTNPLSLVRPLTSLTVRGRLSPSSFTAGSLKQRSVHTQDATSAGSSDQPATSLEATLPLSCPGCGALTQWVDADEAGFYTAQRKPVKAYMHSRLQGTHVPDDTNGSGHEAHASDLPDSKHPSLNKPPDTPPHGTYYARYSATANAAYVTATDTTPGRLIEPPLCDRCHNLIHHNQGTSISHPSVASIHQTILESPFDHNHIYHVLDAADFPLSLVPDVFRDLSLSPQRSKNRRSKTYTRRHGKKPTVSFIITRSDLLAPNKEQVDSLMPYLVEVLRDALGSYAHDIRLGNVRCVSARRGWWTTQMKEEIWNRGGANWMVGKVNVGKSNLFEVVFPKGRNETVSYSRLHKAATELGKGSTSYLAQEENTLSKLTFDAEARENTDASLDEPIPAMDETTLLPPVQPETQFPVMPIISSLPGTTASPIRLSFGGGKGELIDLPGLSRGDLENAVQDEHNLDLVMTSKIKPDQITIKPGQSLLLGGLIRITPLDPMDVFLAYSFTPISPHLTSTEKAIGLQSQERDLNIESIAKDGIGDQISSAGIFELKWNVTKQRAGPLTRSDAVGLREDRLPFKIMSTDILIEGCGWVELTAQVRKSVFRQSDEQNSRDLEAFQQYAPRVEVFSPEGKHIGARRPMNAWLFTKKAAPKARGKARPRKPMAGAKKAAKQRARSSNAA